MGTTEEITIMRFIVSPQLVRIGVCLLVATAFNLAFAAGKNPGSCDSVASSSICIDYSGSYWRTRPKEMRLNCSGPKSTFRAEYCPFDDFPAHHIGSCIYGKFKPMETTAHFYNVGGGGFGAPDFDPNWLKISCQNTGYWVWGPAGGKAIP